MKMLVLSDLHSESKKLGMLLEIAGSGFGAVVFCGDLVKGGTFLSAESDLCMMLGKARLFFVPGNEDSKEVVALAEKKGASLHKKTAEHEGLFFAGIGGGKPVHTYYRFNVGEPEAKKFLSSLDADPKKLVLVSHCPPSGTMLETARSGQKLGLLSLKKFIDEKQPLLSLSGHLHENPWEEMIGRTLALNPGAVCDGKGAVLSVKGKKTSVERISL